MLWSIGNEIPGVFSDMGAEYGPKMAAEIHALDKTRPVTNGILGWPIGYPKKPNGQRCRDSQKNAETGQLEPLDIVGTNYQLWSAVAQHDQFPIASWWAPNQLPRLGEALPRAGPPYVVGDFVWSAQDYLGEVGVGRWFYEGDPPSRWNPQRISRRRSSFPSSTAATSSTPGTARIAGDLDLLGNSKPAAHLRNIVWNMGEKLYLAVRQPAGRQEDHRRRLGLVSRLGELDVAGPGRQTDGRRRLFPLRERAALSQRQARGRNAHHAERSYQATFKLTYQPGILKAVGVEDGKEGEAMQLETMGEPASIKLSADRSTIHADGQDLSFIQVEVVDKHGRLQPNADELDILHPHRSRYHRRPRQCLAQKHGAVPRHHLPRLSWPRAGRPAWIEDDGNAPAQGRRTGARLLRRGHRLPMMAAIRSAGIDDAHLPSFGNPL